MRRKHLNNLFLYLDKIGLDHRPEKIGSTYFYNVPPMVFNVAIVSIDYDTTTPEEMKRQERAEKKLETYCKKYGYMIYNRHSTPGYRFFYVADTEQYYALDYLNMFVTESHDKCIQYMHEHHGEPDAEVNAEVKKIMNYYGNMYNDAIKAINAAENGEAV